MTPYRNILLISAVDIRYFRYFFVLIQKIYVETTLCFTLQQDQEEQEEVYRSHLDPSANMCPLCPLPLKHTQTSVFHQTNCRLVQKRMCSNLNH